MNIETTEPLLLYKVIAGSKLYGLDSPSSDTDIRGIFLQPNEFRLGNGYIEQVSNETNDITYFELNRFINLLSLSNPNIMELLFATEDKVLFSDERIKLLKDNKELFLSKKCKDSFGGYALSQIKKARGLNKKIVKPVAKEKRTPIDFCYLLLTKGSQNLSNWLLNRESTKEKLQELYGVTKINNMKDLYCLYYNEEGKYNGLIKKGNTSNELRLSSVEKEDVPIGVVYFNLDGYSQYCVDYKEYWQWVEKRNPVRYNDNISHNQNYDGKNMMHCLRLLDMAIEIGQGKGVNVVRSDRDWLLSIKKGAVSYDEIMKLVEEKRRLMEEVFFKSNLPIEVDPNLAHNLILKIRTWKS